MHKVARAKAGDKSCIQELGGKLEIGAPGTEAGDKSWDRSWRQDLNAGVATRAVYKSCIQKPDQWQEIGAEYKSWDTVWRQDLYIQKPGQEQETGSVSWNKR